MTRRPHRPYEPPGVAARATATCSPLQFVTRCIREITSGDTTLAVLRAPTRQERPEWRRLDLDAVGDGLKVAHEGDARHQRDELVIVVVLGRVRPGVIGYTTGGVADASAVLGELSGPL
jgi:hypothetical protein